MHCLGLGCSGPGASGPVPALCLAAISSPMKSPKATHPEIHPLSWLCVPYCLNVSHLVCPFHHARSFAKLHNCHDDDSGTCLLSQTSRRCTRGSRCGAWAIYFMYTLCPCPRGPRWERPDIACRDTHLNSAQFPLVSLQNVPTIYASQSNLLFLFQAQILHSFVLLFVFFY